LAIIYASSVLLCTKKSCINCLKTENLTVFLITNISLSLWLFFLNSMLIRFQIVFIKERLVRLNSRHLDCKEFQNKN